MEGTLTIQLPGSLFETLNLSITLVYYNLGLIFMAVDTTSFVYTKSIIESTNVVKEKTILQCKKHKWWSVDWF